MAVLYIAEFAGMAPVATGVAPISDDPPLAEQTVAIGGGSVQSAAFHRSTRFIRVHTDVVCSIAMGLNPTATAAKRRLAANQTEYFGIQPLWKIAVITNA
jgi:hypothetical protein